MESKVLIVLSTGEKEKALTGLLYATNAMRNGWLSDVRLCFFGPFEKLLAEDEELQEWVRLASNYQKPVACKYIAENHGVQDKLTELGLDVEYVGEMVSNSIKEGYVPMVF